jgi:hypothetical protein
MTGTVHDFLAAHATTSGLPSPHHETREVQQHPTPRSSPSSLTPRSLVSPNLTAAPSFTLGDEAVKGSEVEWLLRGYKDRKFAPVDVELRPLPKSRSAAVVPVAEFFSLVRGLRLAWGDDRPVPFAAEWVGGKLGVPKLTVWRALGFLVDAGVLTRCEPLPGRGGKRGTHTYLPAPPTDGRKVP